MPLVALAAALSLAACGGADAPRRLIEPVALDSSAVVELFGKQVAGSGELDAWLDRDPLDLRLDEVTRDGVTLRDVAVRRRGVHATAEATVDPAQLAALAPGDVALRYDRRAPGEGIVLRGTAEVLGLSVPVSVRVVAEDGDVVALPEGLPIGRQVLFDDPRIDVRRISARPLADGLRVRADARLA